ncbi:MAG: TIM barrel protein [Bacteroidetes bacterium]|nr:TIM barrel protein [Bacteroidota bacterium]
MYKIILNTFLIGTLFLMTNCSENKKVQLFESWKVGTSTGLFTDFSQEEFYELKTNGIGCIELSSRIFSNKNREESEALVSDIKKKADNAGIEIWSIHLPYSRVLDISTTNEENRNNMIKECSRLMALCKPLSSQKYVIHPSSEPISDEERPIRLENCIASLKVLNEDVKKYNAQLAVEVLPRTCLGNTSDELLKIVAIVYL